MSNTIKIRNNKYDLEVSTAPITLNNQICYGIINFEECKITVQSSLPKDKMNDVIWHEIIHGIMIEYNIDLLEDEEKIVDELAKAVRQVILDNPFLLEMEKEVKEFTEEDIWR